MISIRLDLCALTGFFSAALTLSACDLSSLPEGDIPPPNVDPKAGCSLSCHGDSNSPAPPNNLAGETDTALLTVGAHRVHLDPAPTWHRKIACSDCHLVPETVGSPGHIDSAPPAELTFGGIALNGGSKPVWTGEAGATCQNTYCHGATMAGGTAVEPVWTQVEGSQAACGSCHGTPPPPPHPEGGDCADCHPTMQPGSLSFRDPDSHINGIVDLAGDNQKCDSCHGNNGISSPPRDLAGNSDRGLPGVGAHEVHLRSSPLYRQITCNQCHTVPLGVGDPGHIDGDNKAELVFDLMNPVGVYNAADATCQNLYCHGNGRGNNGTESWTSQQAMACNSCHSLSGEGTAGLGGRHKKHINDEKMVCQDCHSTVVDRALGIINAALHVNGAHEIAMPTGGTFNAADRRCSNLACHENERW